MSVILLNIAWDIGFASSGCQAITATNPYWVLMEPSSTLWHQSEMADIMQIAFQVHFRKCKIINFN